MKRALMAVAGMALVASLSSVAFADDTNAAYSANAVGVIRYTIPANAGLTCISMPLYPMTNTDVEAWAWESTSLAEQLDSGSMVYFWNGTEWEYVSKNAMTKTWVGPAAGHIVQPGEAFFVKGPSNKPEKSISLLGELPVDETLGYTVTGAGNLDARAANRYPVSEKFSESDLAASLDANSMVYFWSGTEWQYVQKNAMTKTWQGPGGDPQLAVGEGIFIKSSKTNKVVTIERPFEW